MSKLNIVIASPFDFAVPSGVNQHVRHLGAELQRLGHRVTVVAPLSESDGYMPVADFHSFGCVVPVPANGSIAHISFSWKLRSLNALLERERFDIVHCHEPLTPALALAMLHYSKSANIGTFHAYGESSPHYVLARPFLRRFYNRIDGRVAVSELARDFAFRYFGGEFRIIPNGVDAGFFDDDIHPIEHLMDGRPNVLFLGRFEEQRKGFAYALKALAQVRHEIPGVRLVVVGSGDTAKYGRMIEQYGITSHVYFAGAVPDEERARYMASCRLLVAPNTGGESQGMVVLEAMAAGLPVLAADIPAYARNVTHGREGLLVEPENDIELAQAMTSMILDTDRCARMGVRGRAKAADFAWPRVVTELVDFYEEVRETKIRGAGQENRNSSA
jgi:phosphatidyl-myo-inositol alpha-mannosyltransferase